VAQVLRVGQPDKVIIGSIDAERALSRGEIRLKSIISAISHGTELNFVRGSSPFSGKFFDKSLRAFVEGVDINDHDPDVLGYEMVSVVMQVADDVVGIRVGDLIHSGTPHQDQTIVNVGEQLRFGYPVTVLPAGKPVEPALFISLGSVALQAIHDANIKLGDRVLVSGLGSIGLLTTQLAALSGASEIIVSDPIPKRRQLAQQMGATAAIDPTAVNGGLAVELKRSYGPRGVDVAIETSGVYGALHSSIAAVGIGGRVVSVGFYQGEAIGLRLGEEWHHNRPELISSMGVWGCPHRSYPLWDRQRLTDEVRDLVYGDKLKTVSLLTHSVDFKNAQRGYELIMNQPNDVLKMAISFDAYPAYVELLKSSGSWRDFFDQQIACRSPGN
jgi:threonine dehydrogenase-like Zn-dependent dehydrogenase